MKRRAKTPEPMTSADIDVAGLDGFMLNAQRLLASELWALSTGDEFKAAMGLWCRAWQQTPAGSLPNDPRILASFASLTRNRWESVKGMALRGFVLCSDGRLYHRVLCDEVRTAYEKRQAYRKRRDDDRERLRRWRDRKTDGASTDDINEAETRVATRVETNEKRVRQGQGQGQGQGPKRDTPTPEARLGVGGIASQVDDNAKLTAVLDSLGVASGPEANRRWLAQARRNRKAVTFDDQLRTLRYAVRRAREVRGEVYPDGRATVNYASDVREFVTGWAPQAPQSQHAEAVS